MSTRKTARVVRAATFAALLSVSLSGLSARGQEVAVSEPSPASEVALAIDIDAPEETIFRIGVPDLLGPAEEGRAAAEVARGDFRLMPGYRVIDSRSIHHDLAAEGLGLRVAEWSALEASGVIKGELRRLAEGIEVELRLYVLARGPRPALTLVYRGAEAELRAFMHDFGNRVLLELTGRSGPFGTRLAYSRRFGPGRKDVFEAQMDGFGESRISSGEGVALLPAFGPRSIWFTRMTPRATYLTRGGVSDRRLIRGPGSDSGPAICDGRLYFTSSRTGDAEIYSAALNGSDLRRLTHHPGLDLSPACGPDGQLAFVSDRHGSPQIFTMRRDGSEVRRITFQGSYNQTPSWCLDPEVPLLAFTGRDHNLDVFVVNLRSNEITRVTQGQGDNQSPAFSPDCRVLAFASTRAGAPGLYLSSPNGFDQSRVLEGRIEGVRWDQRAPRGIPATAPAPSTVLDGGAPDLPAQPTAQPAPAESDRDPQLDL